MQNQDPNISGGAQGIFMRRALLAVVAIILASALVRAQTIQTKPIIENQKNVQMYRVDGSVLFVPSAAIERVEDHTQ